MIDFPGGAASPGAATIETTPGRAKGGPRVGADPKPPTAPAPVPGDSRQTGGASAAGAYGLSAAAWVKIAIVTLLMAATFRFNLVRLWLKTNPFSGEPNWRHAICIPLIGIYYLFVNRDELLAGPVKPFLWGSLLRPARLWASLALLGLGGAVLAVNALSANGVDAMILPVAYGACAYGLAVLALDWSLATLLFGLFVFTYGIWPGQNDYLKDLGMVITIFGVTALLAGWRVMKVAWFPIAFLVCALPWPELVYSRIAWPLQQLAASVAVGTLRFTGVNAYNSGTKIIMDTGRGLGGASLRTLNVAEACAGLRSLMTFISVGAAVAFLSARPLWQKILITLTAIPIAILCNVMRVSGQGILDHYFSQEWSEGFAHQFAGMMMLIPGFFLLLLVGWVLDKVFIEEADPETAAVAPTATPRKAAQWNVPGESLKESTKESTRATRNEAGGVPASAKAAQPASAKAARVGPAEGKSPASLPPAPGPGVLQTPPRPTLSGGTASAKSSAAQSSAGPSAIKPTPRTAVPSTTKSSTTTTAPANPAPLQNAGTGGPTRKASLPSTLPSTVPSTVPPSARPAAAKPQGTSPGQPATSNAARAPRPAGTDPTRNPKEGA